MKLTVLQENLSQAVNLSSRIVSSRPTLPILGNLLLTAEKNIFTISATNLETSLVIQLPAKIETEGKISLPAKTFQELVISLPVQPVTLEAEREKLKINCAKNFIELKGMLANEFPTIPDFPSGVKTWKIKLVDFVKSCQEVVFSAATDESRPVLSAVRVNIEKKGLELVATDGYRLSRKFLTGELGNEAIFLLPAKTLIELVRINSKEGKLEFFLDKKGNQVIFRLDNLRFVSRLIDGQFPPFGKVIPGSCQTTVVIDREELIGVLKMAAVFAKDSANIIKLKIKNEKLKISANSTTAGEEESEIEAKIEGEEVEIAFNYRFVGEFLASIEAPQVRLKLNGNLSPVLFEVPGDKTLLHVIMPVRVQTTEAPQD